MSSVNVYDTPAQVASVSVSRIKAQPKVQPPDTFNITFEGLTGREVARIRKVLRNATGCSIAQKLGAELQQKTGNMGEFYSNLRVDASPIYKEV